MKPYPVATDEHRRQVYALFAGYFTPMEPLFGVFALYFTINQWFILILNPQIGYSMQLRGDRIVQLKNELKLNQSQLADKLDIRASLLSRYERGNVNLTLETPAQLAQVLNTTTDYLLGLSNIPRAGAEPDPQPDVTPPQIEMVAALKALRDAWARERQS